MRNLRVLLVICAATAAQFALADDQPNLAAIRAACAEDAQKLCAGVQPGGGRIVACLKEHKDSLSDRCKQAAGLPANPSPPVPNASSGSPASGADAAGTASSVPAAKSGATVFRHAGLQANQRDRSRPLQISPSSAERPNQCCAGVEGSK